MLKHRSLPEYSGDKLYKNNVSPKRRCETVIANNIQIV